MGIVADLLLSAGRHIASTLSRPDDLEILTLCMDTGGPEAGVLCEFSRRPELKWAKEEKKAPWKIPAHALGIDTVISDDAKEIRSPKQLPADLIEGLRTHLRVTSDAPLWIQFETPHGYLPLISWETLLGKEIGRPVLRLSDPGSPLPRELNDSLDVVLCASEPRAKSAFDIPRLLPGLAKQIVECGARDKIRVHVFSDVRDYNALKQHASDQIVVYNPSQMPASRTESTDENVWLRWIREALTGTSVDVVHFVCHCYYGMDRGMLALAESPLRNEDREWSRFVDAWDLQPFLIRIGAWAATFSSPPSNFSPIGLRQLAQRFAEIRPGCVSIHDAAADANGTKLQEIYRFLYTPGRQQAPKFAMPVYCTPSMVKVTTPASRLAAGLAFISPSNFGFELSDEEFEKMSEQLERTLQKLQDAHGKVPAWLSASQRYIEQVRFDLDRQERELTPNAAPEIRAALSNRRDQLSKIQQATIHMAQVEAAKK